ncbi:DUF1877 family protein [Hamadaea tsunoensis]|uniref:DUF1877 family protein n=1 Tax=Hamadaea tsunoensis TaxID=53368 RepID=UPI000420A2B2|nr:DUF1877 family protein [Hamadaea tsunoensis]
MSVLGDIARVSTTELERLRFDSDAYGYLSGAQVPKVDLDRYWDCLRFVMDAAGFPVNPIGGRPYPDEASAWGDGTPNSSSCTRTPDEVRLAAASLAATPFAALTKYLPAANAAALYPSNYDWTSLATRTNTARHYGALVAFFQQAAADGQSTVFWAA